MKTDSLQIYLNDIFNLSEKDIKNSKIELNMTAGKGGVPFLEKWLKASTNEKASGTSDCSYWGWFQGKRNFQPGQNVFSFLKMRYNEYLFISAAKIIAVPENSPATVEILSQYQSFFGRLIVNYNKGNKYSRYVFKASTVLNEIIVKEILPCIYQGEDFQGYDSVNVSFGLLKKIFDGEIMPTYYNALKKITGVYCLTDTKTGKLYIGSATGNEGVSQRWGNYLNSSHGGNKKLIKLYDDNGKEYFENHFTFTLLEYFGLSYDAEEIKKREQYWKRCLQTIKFGYNDN